MTEPHCVQIVCPDLDTRNQLWDVLNRLGFRNNGKSGKSLKSEWGDDNLTIVPMHSGLVGAWEGEDKSCHIFQAEIPPICLDWANRREGDAWQWEV